MTTVAIAQCRIPGCENPRGRFHRACNRCLSRIRRHGDPHATPWLQVDERDVEVVVTDRRPAPGLNRLEKRTAAWRLTDAGLAAEEIARILAVTPRTVHRWRAERRAHLRPVPAHHTHTRKAS